MRQMRNLTLVQLAEMIKVSAVTIHNIERDIYEPKISTLTNLSRALDVPLGYFTGAGSEGLFIREREAQFNRKISSGGGFHNLPVIQRLELDGGAEIIVKPDAGLLVMLHLVFGRLEAVSGERTLQLVPGDNLYAELFADLKLRALETSLCVMVNNRAVACSIPGSDGRKKPG
jgi:transcriptional regulator with XRE-family HTH domain